ncbi:AMP-binding protein [Streptomyces scopuliridis]
MTELGVDGRADLVREQRLRTPDRVANTDERITLTYRELWERTEDVATVLAAHGVTPGTTVAVVAGGAHPSCRRRGGTGPGPG